MGKCPVGKDLSCKSPLSTGTFDKNPVSSNLVGKNCVGKNPVGKNPVSSNLVGKIVCAKIPWVSRVNVKGAKRYQVKSSLSNQNF